MEKKCRSDDKQCQIPAPFRKKLIIEVEVDAPNITHATLRDVILVVSPSEGHIWQQGVNRFVVLKDGDLTFK